MVILGFDSLRIVERTITSMLLFNISAGQKAKRDDILGRNGGEIARHCREPCRCKIGQSGAAALTPACEQVIFDNVRDLSPDQVSRLAADRSFYDLSRLVGQILTDQRPGDRFMR